MEKICEIKKGNVEIHIIPKDLYIDKIIKIAKYFSDNEELICYVSVNRLHNVLVEDLEEAGVNLNKFIFIDGITRSIDSKAEGKKNCFYISSPSDLTNISIAINKLIQSKKISALIFDSLSTLLIYNKNLIVYKFIHSLVNKIKQSDITAVLATSEGDTTSQLSDEISMYADNIIYYEKEKKSHISPKEKEKREALDIIYLTAHEMRTPLTSITSLIQLILEEKLGRINEKQKETLKIAFYDARRLALFIESMINRAEITEKKITYKFTKFKLKNLIDEVVNSLQFILNEKKIKVEISEEGSSLIEADKSLIRHVILSLITNAIKYGKQNGHISISIKKENDNILISIKDDGKGIEKSVISHIFEEPYQTKDYKKNPLSGLGYGLYISKKIIDAHKGKIWVESELGKGSVFFILIPPKQKS